MSPRQRHPPGTVYSNTCDLHVLYDVMQLPHVQYTRSQTEEELCVKSSCTSAGHIEALMSGTTHTHTHMHARTHTHTHIHVPYTCTQCLHGLKRKPWQPTSRSGQQLPICMFTSPCSPPREIPNCLYYQPTWVAMDTARGTTFWLPSIVVIGTSSSTLITGPTDSDRSSRSDTVPCSQHKHSIKIVNHITATWRSQLYASLTSAVM